MKTFDFSGKNVLIRVDFNVPQDDQLNITDNTRIKGALSTILSVLNSGGTAVLMSHLGRPNGEISVKHSLKSLVGEIGSLTGATVHFADDCIGDAAKDVIEAAGPGEIVLLENLRFYKEETDGDREFAGALAELGDIYLNDAFGTAHRAHASTAIIAEYFDDDCKGFGALMDAEVKSISKALGSDRATTVAIIGGAKVSSKIGVISNMLENVGTVVIGGGMGFTFVKALGGQIGTSLVEDDKLELARALILKAKDNGCNLLLPVDTLITKYFADTPAERNCPIGEIPDGYMGLDNGPESVEAVKKVLQNATTIIWNGPMGVFEFENYASGTKTVAEAIAKSTANGAFSLIGGGDSVAAINKFGFADKVSYISTGGGAMLEFLEGKELPGVAALS
ncbi:MAG TPA: phosphoglycerate kinase [Cryomorphaceae bacterium]|nr:phosphoglycerate kinase [Cryomorphaceae bacterium]HCY25858.1 phosphoglycerate kinase [Cryomorphaceae bacterium]|tara:strand:- start:204 stop:1385 length:1182 start_codon:yes stop_codon:yes gene_type:complete